MRHFPHGALVALALAAIAATQPARADNPGATPPHRIAAAKLIVHDLAVTQAFYEKMFGMKEVRRYDYAPKVYVESIMAYGDHDDAHLALFSPTAEPPLKKSQFPVALMYTPEFDTLVERIRKAGHPIAVLPPAQSGQFRIAIARDPSGNAIEILARPDQPAAVGGSKLIVNDRKKAEDFYASVFGVKPVQRYQTQTYDEVLMGFGGQAFLALFESKTEGPLPKSQFPVVAIFTHDFDNVLKRIESIGLGYRDVKRQTPGGRIIIAQDPSGNALEIVQQ